jgi:hypothetical protein
MAAPRCVESQENSEPQRVARAAHTCGCRRGHGRRRRAALALAKTQARAGAARRLLQNARRRHVVVVGRSAADAQNALIRPGEAGRLCGRGRRRYARVQGALDRRVRVVPACALPRGQLQPVPLPRTGGLARLPLPTPPGHAFREIGPKTCGAATPPPPRTTRSRRLMSTASAMSMAGSRHRSSSCAAPRSRASGASAHGTHAAR